MKNNQSTKKIGITEVVLRDGHQSLLATRFRYEDMENILKNIDSILKEIQSIKKVVLFSYDNSRCNTPTFVEEYLKQPIKANIAKKSSTV